MKYLNTTGDESLDRELQDLRTLIQALQSGTAGVPPTLVYTSGQGAVTNNQKIPTLLGDLGDVSALAPASLDVLEWNGSNWVNAQVVNSLDGQTGVVTSKYSYRFMFGG